MPDLTPEYLDALEAKAKAATPGPWEWARGYVIIRFEAGEEIIIADCGDGKETGLVEAAQMKPNGLHIAANSPEVTLALVARVRELEREEPADTLAGLVEQLQDGKKLKFGTEERISCPASRSVEGQSRGSRGARPGTGDHQG